MKKKIGVHQVTVEEDGEESVELPGFRFHPTDEELVRFYLRRKVDKKTFSLEIIKDIDIYKFDPWDLPKVIGAREKEWYFFCLRGRKYKNSVRPNRVTGSGFWKATGIDRPIYSGSGDGDCIGLKKSLVYYRGSAGKGTKTDWMMHEFRLPSSISNVGNITPSMEDAEIWTICRIFKRDVSYKKYAGKCKESTNCAAVPSESSSVKADSTFEFDSSNLVASCTSNPDRGEMPKYEQIYYDQGNSSLQLSLSAGRLWNSDQCSLITQGSTPLTAALHPNSVPSPDIDNLFRSEQGNYNWDELGMMMDLMTDHSSVTYDYLYV